MPAGLVEIVEESKGTAHREVRRFVVRYTCPWMGGHEVIAFGHELQLTT
jgi:hypothetical protein